MSVINVFKTAKFSVSSQSDIYNSVWFDVRHLIHFAQLFLQVEPFLASDNSLIISFLVIKIFNENLMIFTAFDGMVKIFKSLSLKKIGVVVQELADLVKDFDGVNTSLMFNSNIKHLYRKIKTYRLRSRSEWCSFSNNILPEAHDLSFCCKFVKEIKSNYHCTESHQTLEIYLII